MDKQTFFSSVWNVFAFLMDEQGVAFLLLPCSLSREPSPKPSAPTSHTSHLPARLCCSVSKKDVDTEGAHTRGIIQPPNRPRVGSVVLEYSGPLDGKEGLPLLLRFESSLLPPSFSTLQRARLREGSGGRGSKLPSTVLPSYPACFLGLAPWATPS